MRDTAGALLKDLPRDRDLGPDDLVQIGRDKEEAFLECYRRLAAEGFLPRDAVLPQYGKTVGEVLDEHFPGDA